MHYRFYKLLVNIYPPYLGAGSKVLYIKRKTIHSREDTPL